MTTATTQAPHHGDLDFLGYRGARVHPYPATMPLPVAQVLLERYTGPGARVLDPFLGSGTTLRAAAAIGRPAIGIDMNPLACLIARVSTAPFHPAWCGGTLWDALAQVGDLFSNEQRLDPPSAWAPWVERWFEEGAASSLGSIASAIDRTDAVDSERDFLLTAFSRTVRKSSLARLGELKLWRRPSPEPVDVLSLFRDEALDLLATLHGIRSESTASSARPDVIHGDSANVLDSLDPVDAVLTSPPYGDSWTTVAYGNFTMLSCIWLGTISREFVDEDPTRADHRAPGGSDREPKAADRYRALAVSETLREARRAINTSSEQRADDLAAFYGDLLPILGSICGRLDRGGHLILVMGPRHMAGTLIDGGRIVSEILCSLGLSYETREVRLVSGKRLPSKTVQGRRGRAETINRETIDVLSKR